MTTGSRDQQIAEELHAAILAGELGPGDRLPTESELEVRYQTDRGTVRRAIASLRAQGLVTTFRGRRGTTVNPAKQRMLRYHPRSVRGGPYNTRDGRLVAAELGVEPVGQFKLVSAEVITPSPRETEWLALDPGQLALVRRRHLIKPGVDPQVLQMYDSYFPAHLAIGTVLQSHGLIEHGVWKALEAMGITIVRFEERVSARMPMAYEARMLQLGPATPLLETVRIAWDRSDRVVEALYVRMSAATNEVVYSDLLKTDAI